MALEKQQFLLNIRGQEPLNAAAPLYSNFVSIARIGSDVQLEFIFLDINQLALLTNKMKNSPTDEPQEIVGKTIAKIVMNGANFVQIREHINTVFDALIAELQLEVKNEPDARQSSNSSVR